MCCRLEVTHSTLCSEGSQKTYAYGAPLYCALFLIHAKLLPMPLPVHCWVRVWLCHTQAFESPLAVTVAAGSVALPALLKLAQVMEKNGQDLSACEQLPIELELGQEFVFHSIFACPVSRDQSTPDNPPKLLPCNHVLCEQSIAKISRSRNKVFKCPYCPMEARADNTRKLIFPDVQ